MIMAKQINVVKKWDAAEWEGGRGIDENGILELHCHSIRCVRIKHYFHRENHDFLSESDYTHKYLRVCSSRTYLQVQPVTGCLPRARLKSLVPYPHLLRYPTMKHLSPLILPCPSTYLPFSPFSHPHYPSFRSQWTAGHLQFRRLMKKCFSGKTKDRKMPDSAEWTQVRTMLRATKPQTSH